MRSEWKRLAVLAGLCLVVVLSGCKTSATAEEANDELGQSLGDVVDAIDDAAMNAGAVRRSAEEPTFRTACADVTFGACTDNVRTRNFGGCTVGTRTFTGSTTLTYVDAAVDNTCSALAAGNSISRKPNWTVTGARGWSIAVTSTGTYGQKLIFNDPDATFQSDGIRRVATNAAGEVVADHTTKTTTALAITFDGGPRLGRVVTTGAVEITDNLSGKSCSVVPTNLTWEGTCTCPTSGTVDGTCGENDTYTMTFSGGCGQATIKVGDTSIPITLSRCAAVTPG